MPDERSLPKVALVVDLLDADREVAALDITVIKPIGRSG
jgi:hypothetical protein